MNYGVNLLGEKQILTKNFLKFFKMKHIHTPTHVSTKVALDHQTYPADTRDSKLLKICHSQPKSDFHDKVEMQGLGWVIQTFKNT